MSYDLSEISHQLFELLKRQGADIDRSELIAEIHDFLAMLYGIKPVFLHGRGLAPENWIEEVLNLARDLELEIIEGPFWDATPYGEFPNWYHEHCRAELKPYRAWYICQDAETVDAVQSVNSANGRLSIPKEAKLLGYPECCVNAHYARASHYHRGTLSILKRLTKGNEKQMQDLVRGGAHLAPETEKEIKHFDAAFEIHEPELGSWNMCASCVRSTNQASATLVQQYLNLIEECGLKLG
ncbi:MAG: hypothetical protein CMM52_12365 [Rhodospirillaceae bacterium]|nr:hypothetical protein [Rhodospirillaceae bacterium]|tara:strand:+ start:17653 stop:18372 length:720 start_codon:yes stop_codon:yes gene_type:complete